MTTADLSGLDCGGVSLFVPAFFLSYLHFLLILLYYFRYFLFVLQDHIAKSFITALY